ncbi:hypothetical protein CDD80_4988 [Ophiocordyceps camponoti-rufipedis]|uniref:Uncharacterized protein n=1 Tax=Ophiocordyceps camponoti-rufipedis TaxID=2004952 RepID=A0A2C5YSR1_9HYPO|nr:hypothetical protein CDD80_4988 [Ophiocordyceps camponoti-rufipedis]
MRPSSSALAASLRPRRVPRLGRALPPSFRPASRCWAVSGPRRYASSDRPELPPSPPPPPKMTKGQYLGNLLQISFKNLFVALTPSGIRSAYRGSPGTTITAFSLLLLFIVFSYLGYKSVMDVFYSNEICRYPEPVATSLRRAIYYSTIRPDKEWALRYFKKAMDQCVEIGLDPFSDEVLGIRIQVAGWLEQNDEPKTAVRVLEKVLEDCQKWVAFLDQCVKDGKVDDAGRYRDSTSTVAADEINAAAETLWRRRERLLQKAVGTSVKLGGLYADKRILMPEMAHERLVWAVETSLSELQRRQREGPKAGEEGWLTMEEMGAAMESLGQDYASRGQWQLSIPLYFQALRMCGDACQRTVIMNNLAVAFASQPLYAPKSPTEASGGETDEASSGPVEASEAARSLLETPVPMTRQQSLEAALNWARNAYKHAVEVEGEERTATCDEACNTALCAWADIAAQLGMLDEARSKYVECLEMGRKLKFSDASTHARKGLVELDNRVKLAKS